jgi:hypothetical protein
MTLRNVIGKDGFIWAIGVVEDREDPLMVGRLKVRYVNFHTDDKQQIKTEDLPWSYPLITPDHGSNTIGPREGDWVLGFFLDGLVAQEPVHVGIIPGIGEEKANPDVGFFDATPAGKLNAANRPRPPFMVPLPPASPGPAKSLFSDPEQKPGQGPQYGVLQKDYSPATFSEDIQPPAADGGKAADEKPMSPAMTFSRYPLEPYLLEPLTNRFERGWVEGKIDQTIVADKLADIWTADCAEHENSGIGTDTAAPAEPMAEPPTPYNAIYPFNHCYYSESGHLHETDDTPFAERIHDYHRSGTFHEIHPTGTEVSKSKEYTYNFTKKSWFGYAKEFVNFTAQKMMRLLGTEGVNISSQQGDINLTVGGGKFNLFVKSGDSNMKVSGDCYNKVDGKFQVKIDGDSDINIDGNAQIRVGGDAKILVEGDMLQKVDGDYKLAVGGAIDMRAGKTIGLTTPEYVSTAGSAKTYLSETWGKIHAYDAEFADKAAELGGPGAEPLPPENPQYIHVEPPTPVLLHADGEFIPDSGFVAPAVPGAPSATSTTTAALSANVQTAQSNVQTAATSIQTHGTSFTGLNANTHISGPSNSLMSAKSSFASVTSTTNGAWPLSSQITSVKVAGKTIHPLAALNASDVQKKTLAQKHIAYNTAVKELQQAYKDMVDFFGTAPKLAIWSPISVVNGKAFIMSDGQQKVSMYEAIPTDKTEKLTYHYTSVEGYVTTWNIIRPVHKRGKLIERAIHRGYDPVCKKHIYRFSKEGVNYSGLFMLLIGTTEVLMLTPTEPQHILR